MVKNVESVVEVVQDRKMLSCITCKRSLTNLRGSTIFNCPNCGKYAIIRCFYCRRLAARYTCPSCSFSGPN